MKQRIKSILKYAVLLIIIGSLTAGVVYVIKLKLTARKIPFGDESIIAYNMRIRVWKDDKVRWDFRARKVVITPDRNNYTIENIYDGIFISKNKAYKFTAAGGTYDEAQKKVSFAGRAVMRSATDNDYFKMEKLDWDGQSERLSLSGGIEAGQSGNIYSGDRLISINEDLDSFSIMGNVAVYLPDVTRSETMGKQLKEADVKKSDIRNVTLHGQRIDFDGIAKTMHAQAEEIPGAALTQNTPPMSPLIQQGPGTLPNFNPPQNMPLPLPPPPGDIGALPLPPSEVVPSEGMPSLLPPTFRQPGPRPKALVTFHSRAYDIESTDLFVDYEHGRFARSTGSVRIVKKGGKPNKNNGKAVQAMQKRTSTMFCDQAEYFWREGRVSISGFVTIKQKDMDISAGSAQLFTKLDRAELRGGVSLHQNKGEWLIKEDVIDKDASDKTKEAAKEETTIICNALDLDFKTDGITATGNINVIQKERSLTARSAVYDGNSGVWQIWGDVKANDKGDLYSAPMVEYNEKTKELLALNGATAIVKQREEDSNDMQSFFSDRDGEDFNAETFKKEKISVSGKQLHYDEKKDVMKADGNASLQLKDVSMLADHLLVNYADKKAHGEGSAILRDKYTTVTGDKIDADWAKHTYTVTGNVRLTYAGRPETKDKEKIDPFDLTCRTLDYNSETHDGVADGAPVITASARRGAADSISFNTNTNIYIMRGNVKLHQENGDWLRGKDYIDADDKQAWFLADKPTDIASDNARFETDNDYFLLTGKVKIDQQDKSVRSDRAEFFGKQKRLLLDGDITLAQTRGEWLFEGGFIEEDEDEDIKKRAHDKIEITADHVESLYGEKKLHITGGVTIVQGESRATGDSVWHYGKDKLTVIEGNVHFKDADGRDLTAKRIVYDGKKKELEAFNTIRGAGYVEKKK